MVRVADLGLSDWPIATRVSARYALATNQGEVLYDQHHNQRCPIQHLDVGEIIDGSVTYCRGGNNSWFRSQSIIIGSNYCITAP